MLRATPAASPEAIDRPNFWSSVPVVTARCTWALTPGMTRTRTFCRRPAQRGQHGKLGRLARGINDDPADAVVQGRSQILRRLAVPVQQDAPGRKPGRAA